MITSGCLVALSATLAVLSASVASAQVGSIATVSPTLSPITFWDATTNGGGPTAQANSLTVLITSGGAQTISALLDNRINQFPRPVTITTQWNLSALITAVDLVGYFTAPAAALVTVGYSIPSSRMRGRMLSGTPTTYMPFTGNTVRGIGTAGGTLHLFRQTIIGPFNGIGQRTDNLDLQLDLQGLPNIPTGTYVGTLTLRAIAY